MANVTTTHRIVRRESGFVQVDNSVARDSNLSFCARGILLMVLSHSDGWRTSQNWIRTQTSKEGAVAVRNALGELVAAGHLERRTTRGASGRIEAHVMIWHEVPITRLSQQVVDNQRPNQNAENPQVDMSTSGKVDHTEYHPMQNNKQTEYSRQAQPAGSLTPIQARMERLKQKAAESLARTASRREEKKKAGNATAVWSMWVDACRRFFPDARHVEPTRATLAMLHRCARRLFTADAAKLESGLSWIIEHWQTLRVTHFAWMVANPAPVMPSVPFFVKFADKFSEAYRDALHVERVAQSPEREVEIALLMRKGRTRAAAEAEVVRRAEAKRMPTKSAAVEETRQLRRDIEASVSRMRTGRFSMKAAKRGGYLPDYE